jgi:hypothetical protein
MWIIRHIDNKDHSTIRDYVQYDGTETMAKNLIKYFSDKIDYITFKGKKYLTIVEKFETEGSAFRIFEGDYIVLLHSLDNPENDDCLYTITEYEFKILFTAAKDEGESIEEIQNEGDA